MSDLSWGDRDKRGEWQPAALPKPSPLFRSPIRIREIVRYLFGYPGFLLPITAAFAALAVGTWYFLTPDQETLSRLSFGWIAGIYARNVVILLVVAGGLHLRLYSTRTQGVRFKYTDKWLSRNDKKFLFGSQTADNVFWSLTSGAFFWTAWEAVTLWMQANGRIPRLSFTSRPVFFVLLMIGLLFWRMFHFYWIHRFIHWKPMFKLCHYLHHKNINIGPWSGLTMHPLEHLIYFSGVLLYWIVPAHPIHIVFHLLLDGASPAIGHNGFHRVVGESDKGLSTDHYFHYLHHRFFTVNFGDESVPLDKWFGSHHDGSPEAHTAMMEKRKRRR